MNEGKKTAFRRAGNNPKRIRAALDIGQIHATARIKNILNAEIRIPCQDGTRNQMRRRAGLRKIYRRRGEPREKHETARYRQWMSYLALRFAKKEK